VHHQIGMGGDQLVAALAGDEVEERLGDEIREAESELYRELIDEVRGMEGSRELIEDLREAGHVVVLASSAKQWEVEHYIELLDAAEIVDAWTTSDDVEGTKPEPDLIKAALEKAGTEAGRCGDPRRAHRGLLRAGAQGRRRQGCLHLSERAAALTVSSSSSELTSS
jgi:phosphoglycolate phosphatase-like HAD superfamily hydrolase